MMRSTITAKIKVPENWVGMDKGERREFLVRSLRLLAARVITGTAGQKTILDPNGNTTHITLGA